MSVSGIVRRMDELGRIVIPKELRKTLRLKEGDEMEIFPDGDGLYVRRRCGLCGFERTAEAAAKFLWRRTGCAVIVAAGGEIVAAAGDGLRAAAGRKLNKGLDFVFSSREKLVMHDLSFPPAEGMSGAPVGCVVAVPVTVHGDVRGEIIAFGDEAEKNCCEFELAAEMLGAVMEQ